MKKITDVKEYFYRVFNANPSVPVIEKDYAFMMPCFTDLHIIPREMKTRKHYFERSISLLLNIEEFLIKNGIKYVTFMGDIFDAGTETADKYAENLVKHCFYRIVKDRMTYTLLGNHEAHFSKYNLFYEMVDFHSKFLKENPPKEHIYLPAMPYFTATDSVTLLNKYKIYFMHYDPNKRYYVDSADTFNIALFHEDLLSLESKDSLYHHKAGMGIDIETTNIMDNIDIAICAHIHKPMKPFRLNNARRTLVIIPGAMCQRTRAEDHSSVDIPVICFTKEGELVIEYVTFQLGDIEETIKKEEDIKQQKQRQIKKEIDKVKEEAKMTDSFGEYLKSLRPDIRKIVDEAEVEFTPSVVSKYQSGKY